LFHAGVPRGSCLVLFYHSDSLDLIRNSLNIEQVLRQTRELVRFVSQFSFLKWNNPSLYLEVTNKEEVFQIEKLLTPQVNTRLSDVGAEVLNLGSDFQGTALSDLTISQINVIDTEFTEGSKTRVTHLRTERSAKLKDFYFSNTSNPNICDMCSMDTEKRYPWANRIIELHHLLPLCSPVRVDSVKTSIKDIVGVCPSCHRATHKFYGKWLKTSGFKDFQNYDEARYVYNKAKQELVLT
jgi:predicted HNH restriction endonuclease